MCRISTCKVFLYWFCNLKLFTKKLPWWHKNQKAGSSSLFEIITGCKFAQAQKNAYLWICTRLALPKSESWSRRETQKLTYNSQNKSLDKWTIFIKLGFLFIWRKMVDEIFLYSVIFWLMHLSRIVIVWGKILYIHTHIYIYRYIYIWYSPLKNCLK